MIYAKDLREKRAKLVADARALLDALPAGEAIPAEINAKFDEMMNSADGLKTEIDRVERLETVEQQLNARNERRAGRENISTDEAAELERTERAAFGSYLRNGFGGMSEKHRAIAEPRFQAALSVGTATAGGYTVPQGFYDQLIDAQLAYGGMLAASYVFDTDSGNALPIPTDNDTTNIGAILTENTQAGTQDATFGAITLNAYTYTSKIVLVSNQLLNDSAFNLESFLNQKLATRIARAINKHFTTGTGTSQPTGAVTAAVLGKTGLTGQTTSIITDDLIDLEHSVDPAYRPGAKFMMGDLSLRNLKKLKDSQGRPLWLPGLAVQEPDTINGYGYVINQDMPVMAANAKSVLFGAFSNYYIRRVAGVQVLRLTERYADYNQTAFLAFQRFDGNLIDAGTHPLAYYANSAT